MFQTGLVAHPWGPMNRSTRLALARQTIPDCAHVESRCGVRKCE
jgi:hypothetical protein